MELDVMVAGELFIDLVMSGFDAWPQAGREAFAKAFHREAGGAAITACGLATLGTRTGVLGVVGEDSGQWIIDRLRRSGVDTSEIRCDPSDPTAITIAIAMPDDRAFLTYPGANRRLGTVLAEGHFSKARHVHLSCRPDLEPAGELLTRIRRAGSSISLDPGWHEAWLEDSRALALLPLIDIFFPNAVEARRMTGEPDPEKILARFAEAGGRRVVLKLGADGAAMLWDDQTFLAPAPLVTAIDPTGAGDCFDAGFLYMWLRGESPGNCLKAANICGALSTEALGGIAGFPNLERLEREMRA